MSMMSNWSRRSFGKGLHASCIRIIVLVACTSHSVSVCFDKPNKVCFTEPTCLGLESGEISSLNCFCKCAYISSICRRFSVSAMT